MLKLQRFVIINPSFWLFVVGLQALRQMPRHTRLFLVLTSTGPSFSVISSSDLPAT